MVAGHLQEKKGYFYMVLTYKDHEGKRKSKWITTGLTVKGNKKRAQDLLQEAKKNFIPDIPVPTEDMLFSDFLKQWLEIAKSTIQLTTYSSYIGMSNSAILPYFKEKNIKLTDLKPKDIQDFYTLQLKRVKASTVIHYHAIIHKALKYAVKIDLIPTNPASKIERPRQERFVGSFYDTKEMNQLFDVAKGTNLEIPILLGAFYGLRRSEVVGLKWSAIDFENNSLVIKHTVTAFNLDGKHIIQAKDSTKNKSSMRTLPLVPAFKEKLIAMKEKQEFNRKLCGRSYSKDYLDYICVNELGVRLRPGHITTAFPKLLEDHGLRRIRFHDLRHSCASLLLANNVPMKQIQDWLGHSDFSTTANIYAHLDYNSKISSAQAMVDGLNFVIETPKEVEQKNDVIQPKR
jgi:integrase